jgi:hypothetical protein
MSAEQNPGNVPTLVYVFDIKQWNEQLNPLTKLEFVDFIPKVCSQFFYDVNVPAFILTLTKPKWDGLPDEIKIKYKSITRRLREEVEGPMTQQQRDQYDLTDPFDAFKKKAAEEAAAAEAASAATVATSTDTETIVAVEPETNSDVGALDMSAIEASLDDKLSNN